MKIDNQDDEAKLQRLAESLTVVPDCPRAASAIEAIAYCLEENCVDWDEAAWVVKEAQKWQKWQGPYGLIELIERRRPTARPSNAPERKLFDMGPKPPVECEKCGDLGFIELEGSRLQFCSCAQGAWLRENCPHLEKWPRRMKELPPKMRHTPAPDVERKPITQADVDEEVRKRNLK